MYESRWVYEKTGQIAMAERFYTDRIVSGYSNNIDTGGDIISGLCAGTRECAAFELYE